MNASRSEQEWAAVQARIAEAIHGHAQDHPVRLVTNLPYAGPSTLADLERDRPSLFESFIPMPQMTLRWSDLEWNVATLQAYADTHGAALAPHGKTTMAPHIFLEQMRAGAWGITLATTTQVRSVRRFGFDRVLLANQVVLSGDLMYLANELKDETFELLVAVDSVDGLKRWSAAARAARLHRPVDTLVELGMNGGRTGVRTVEDASAIIRAARVLPEQVRVVGIIGYEGIAGGASLADRRRTASAFLSSMASLARRVRSDIDVEQPIISAGGSVFFDEVVARLGTSKLPEYRLILRSGGYVTHDSGLYEDASPLSAASPDRIAGAHYLRAALRLWAPIISRPEPGLAIAGFGHRDSPSRTRMPAVEVIRRQDGTEESLPARLPVRRMDDHHAYIDVPDQLDLRVGDLIGCGVSHPCEAFERWRMVLAVDDHNTVLRGVPTFF